jgi:cystathionine beta-lyase
MRVAASVPTYMCYVYFDFIAKVDMAFDFDRINDRRNTDSLKWSDPQGKNAIPMWVADMDFIAPECVVRALQQRIDKGVFGYAIPTAAVQQAAVEWARSHYEWHIDPEWIVWLPGLVSGIHLACRTLANSDEEILSPVPVYPPFLSAPRIEGRALRTVPLTQAGDGWVLDMDALRTAVQPKTKLLLFCNPHNPVGKVFGREELLQIAGICERQNLVICSDEIHCDLMLKPGRHVPFASLSKEVADRTVTLMSSSKTFNLSGISCGYAVIPNPELRQRFQAAAGDTVSHPNVFGYVACQAAYESGEAWRLALIDYLRGNRDFMQSFLGRHVPGLRMSRVEATYLAWIDTRPLGEKATAAFFEEAGVRLSSGIPFQGPGFVRLNFACPRQTLRDALEKISAAINNIS